MGAEETRHGPELSLATFTVGDACPVHTVNTLLWCLDDICSDLAGQYVANASYHDNVREYARMVRRALYDGQSIPAYERSG